VINEADAIFLDLIQSMATVFNCTNEDKQSIEYIRELLSGGELAVVAIGRDWGVNALRDAVTQAIRYPAEVQDMELKKVRDTLIIFSCNGRMDDNAINEAIENIKITTLPNTKVKVIHIMEQELEEDEVKVVIIGAGYEQIDSGKASV